MRKDFRTKKRDSKPNEGRGRENGRNDTKSDARSSSNYTRKPSRNENRDGMNNKSSSSNRSSSSMPRRDDRRDGSHGRSFSRGPGQHAIRDGRNTTQKDNKIRSRTRHKGSMSPTVELGFNEYRLKGIYSSKSKRGVSFYTESFNPGDIVYDEKIVSIRNIEYREWNPKKSKLGAAIYNGCSQIGIKPGSTVLYLGCSTGTTCSHVSDIIGEGGFVFGLDVAPRVMREYVFLCEKRKNMAPLLKDAHQPSQYTDVVPKVDVVFQDIAQRDQVDIFIKNCDTFLKENGTGMIAVKARSIDVTRRPSEIFEEVREVLEKKMAICDSRTLEPYEKDHYFFVVKHKK